MGKIARCRMVQPESRQALDPSTDCSSAQVRTDWRLGAVLAFWFVTSTGFNDFTPRLLNALQLRECTSIDLTLIELAVTAIIATASLKLRGLSILPSTPPAIRFTAVSSLAHLAGCRLFVHSLGNGIPVSLAQTIRAMNSLFAVALGILTGKRYTLPVLSCLVPLVLGFGMAAAAELSTNLEGVLCAAGSVMCLVCVNMATKRLSEDKSQRVDSSELQCWLCIGALVWLIPLWVYGEGVSRLKAAFVQDAMSEQSDVGGLTDRTPLWLMCVIDGAFYFSEQIAQFAAIDLLTPLPLAVTDTVRRLFIVMVAGFVLQGNPCATTNILGACFVCLGAGMYAKQTAGNLACT